MVAGVLLVVSFAVTVAGAVLFTNAVEWAGLRLGLGHGAVGSVLAAVATAMPESLIPVVAIIQGRQEGGADEPGALYFDTTKDDPPTNVQILLQTLIGVGMLVGAAELFVGSIEHLAHGFGIDALVLTLVIAPLATELPEALNSVLWIRQGKDTLALGNVTGAMVLQTMPLVAFGMVFTDWRLTAPALIAMLAALAGAALSLVAVRHAGRWPVPFIGCWTGLYLGGIASIIAVS